MRRPDRRAAATVAGRPCARSGGNIGEDRRREREKTNTVTLQWRHLSDGAGPTARREPCAVAVQEQRCTIVCSRWPPVAPPSPVFRRDVAVVARRRFGNHWPRAPVAVAAAITAVTVETGRSPWRSTGRAPLGVGRQWQRARPCFRPTAAAEADRSRGARDTVRLYTVSRYEHMPCSLRPREQRRGLFRGFSTGVQCSRYSKKRTIYAQKKKAKSSTD